MPHKDLFQGAFDYKETCVPLTALAWSSGTMPHFKMAWPCFFLFTLLGNFISSNSTTVHVTEYLKYVRNGKAVHENSGTFLY